MTTPSRTRKALAGAALAASVGLGGLTVAAVNPLGIAGAQADPEPSPGERCRPRSTILTGVLAGLVTDGTLTQEQADAVTDGVRTAGQERRGGGPSEGDRPGRGGPRGHRGGPALRGAREAAGDAIGVEPESLREALRSGRSLAEVAEEAGVERQTVVDAIVAQAIERIDDAVDDGRLEAERAEALKAELPERAGRLVDATRPGC